MAHKKLNILTVQDVLHKAKEVQEYFEFEQQEVTTKSLSLPDKTQSGTPKNELIDIEKLAKKRALAARRNAAYAQGCNGALSAQRDAYNLSF